MSNLGFKSYRNMSTVMHIFSILVFRLLPSTKKVLYLKFFGCIHSKNIHSEIDRFVMVVERQAWKDSNEEKVKD